MALIVEMGVLSVERKPYWKRNGAGKNIFFGFPMRHFCAVSFSFKKRSTSVSIDSKGNYVRDFKGKGIELKASRGK